MILSFVAVFGILALWQNRSMFGVEGDYNYLAWLGLSSERSSSSPKTSRYSLPTEEDTKYTVTLRDPILAAQEAAKAARETSPLGGGGSGPEEIPRYGQELSRAYGTATLNQPVLFIFKKTSGNDTRRVMPKGTVVEVVRKTGSRMKIRMMGREGWLSQQAVE